MDLSKAESKLQKDIMKQRQEHLDKQNVEKAAKESDQPPVEDDEEVAEEEQRPTGIV